jgi:hypothetical protein
MPNMMVTAEKAMRKKTNQILASTTKKYKSLMRKATKAASEHKREQYIAAAIGAVVLAGVAASKMKSAMDTKKVAAGLRSASKLKTKKKKARL